MNRISAFFLAVALSTIGLAQTPADMLERALPGVVTVAINETSPAKRAMGAASGTDRFNKAYDRVLDLSDAKGSGSGFLIQRGGRMFIVTNAHVVEMADPGEIYAYSVNQTRYKLKVFGGDSFYDIALLEFDEPDKPGPELTPLSFRPDDPRVTPIITALLPPNEPNREVVAWATQRDDGGRGFGFCGGHFYRNWNNHDLRQVIVNGILWSAKADIPKNGAKVDIPADELIVPLDVKPAAAKKKK